MANSGMEDDQMADAKVSGKELGEFLDVNERSIRRYAKAGVIIKVGYGKYALRESVRNYVGVLRKAASGHTTSLDVLILDGLKAEGLDFNLD
jgi:hypothetical protein